MMGQARDTRPRTTKGQAAEALQLAPAVWNWGSGSFEYLAQRGQGGKTHAQPPPAAAAGPSRPLPRIHPPARDRGHSKNQKNKPHLQQLS